MVLQDISFQVEAGGALLLLGPNGAGKSTLLRVLAGLVRLEAGQVLWNGIDALADLPEHARRLAYLGHQDAIKPALTAAENLRFPPAPRAEIDGALARLGLEPLADLPARMLSAGQRRRLALARYCHGRRSGCWTNPRSAWMRRRWTRRTGCSPCTARAAASS